MIEWVRPPLSKNSYRHADSSWVSRGFFGRSLYNNCPRRDLEKTLCSFGDVQAFELPGENKSVLQNLYSKVGKQKCTRHFSKHNGHVRNCFGGDGYSKSSFGEQDYPGSMWGSLLCPPLLLLAPRPLHPHLCPHWLFPFLSHGAILSPYLLFLSLSLSSLCPFSLLFSEPCRESFSCLLSFLT